MGPFILFGIALALLVLIGVGLWHTIKAVHHFSQSLWHFFIDVKTTR